MWFTGLSVLSAVRGLLCSLGLLPDLGTGSAFMWQHSFATVLSTPSSVAGAWVNFSERGPLSTESAAITAGQETHPQPGQAVGFVT